jgi:multidrug efflux pump
VAGVNTREIARTIQTAIRGTEASKYRIGEDEYDIRVRLAPEARASLDALSNLTLTDEDGRQIPLRSIVELETGVGPGSIRRVDLRRVVTIEGDVVRAPGRTEDSVRAEVAARLDG